MDNSRSIHIEKKEPKYCPGCMNEVSDEGICEICGFDLSEENDEKYLAYGTRLSGRYVTGIVLEKTADAVTYLGIDTMTKSCVRIREFFPDEIVYRDENGRVKAIDGSEKLFVDLKKEFLNIYHGLKSLKTLKSAIAVLDVFEANSTCIAIAEADGSETLSDYLDENDGVLSPETVMEKILPSLEILSSMHDLGFVHGSISTDTLFLCADGTFKLWGFSIKEVRQVAGPLSAELYDGYAASEQYKESEEIDAYTDIYSFTAVMYRCLTGIDVMSATDRMKSDTLSIPADTAKKLPEYLVAALVGGLQLYAEDRIRTVDELLANLDEEKYVEKMKLRREAELNEQKAVYGDTNLLDPLTALTEEEYNSKPAGKKASKTKSAPVVNEPIPLEDVGAKRLPVVKRDRTTPQEKGNQTASTVLLAMCIILVMLIFFATLTVTGVISINVSTKGSSVEKVFEMPDFANVSKTDPAIEKLANDYNLNITLQPDNSTEVPANVIMKQSIAAGTKVATGSSLVLTYSKGASTVTLPNFVGLPFTETVYYFGKLNLKYDIEQKENPGDKTAGTIATMTPAAGSVVEEGSEIVIEIWGDSNILGNQESGQTNSDQILSGVLGKLTDRLGSLLS